VFCIASPSAEEGGVGLGEASGGLGLTASALMPGL